MNAREEILARIRVALGPAAGRGDPAPAPERDYLVTDDPDVERMALLAERLADYHATVRRCSSPDLAGAVAAALAGTHRVVAPADLPEEWFAAYQGPVVRDASPALLTLADLDAPGTTVVTGCAAAIAETGTIILDAGPGQGRRALTLVPDHHVCVVRAEQVAVSVPAGLSRLTDVGRPLTLISGPSATSDIELDRVEGVHGPRRLDVVLVG